MPLQKCHRKVTFTISVIDNAVCKVLELAPFIFRQCYMSIFLHNYTNTIMDNAIHDLQSFRYFG